LDIGGHPEKSLPVLHVARHTEVEEEEEEEEGEKEEEEESEEEESEEEVSVCVPLHCTVTAPVLLSLDTAIRRASMESIGVRISSGT
jgi:hypothetical protein